MHLEIKECIVTPLHIAGKNPGQLGNGSVWISEDPLYSCYRYLELLYLNNKMKNHERIKNL